MKHHHFEFNSDFPGSMCDKCGLVVAYDGDGDYHCVRFESKTVKFHENEPECTS